MLGRRDPMRLPRRRSAELSNEEIQRELTCDREQLVLRNPLRGEPLDCLLERLQYPEERIRCLAAEALGGVGPKACCAIPALISCLEDSSRKVRYYTAQALGNIGTHGDLSAPALVRLIDRETDLSHGSPAKAAILSLDKLAHHKPYHVMTLLWKEASQTLPIARIAAIKCLYLIGTQSPKLLEESLERASRSKIQSLHQTAAILREKLGTN